MPETEALSGGEVGIVVPKHISATPPNIQNALQTRNIDYIFHGGWEVWTCEETIAAIGVVTTEIVAVVNPDGEQFYPPHIVAPK